MLFLLHMQEQWMGNENKQGRLRTLVAKLNTLKERGKERNREKETQRDRES